MWEKIQSRLAHYGAVVPGEFEETVQAFYNQHSENPLVVLRSIYVWSKQLEHVNSNHDVSLYQEIPQVLAGNKILNLNDLTNEISQRDSILKDICVEHNTIPEEFSAFDMENTCTAFFWPFLAQDYLETTFNEFLINT